MERTVPRTDTEEIDLYIRTYYSLLRSTGEVAIETLVETHEGMDSLLHSQARSARPDVSALIYASLRLPTCITRARLILLGQRTAVFQRWGYPTESWEPVSAPARRRRAYFDGHETLALYIASRSDIDDILPTLTAYQIEWNKIHYCLSTTLVRKLIDGLTPDSLLDESVQEVLASSMNISLDDLARLLMVWKTEALPSLQVMAGERKKLAVRLLAGSLADYRKAVGFWWRNIRDHTASLEYDNRRVYFISSNPHSVSNLWTGHALRRHDDLIRYMEEAGHESLLAEYHDIESQAVPSNRENFFYYVFKKYLQDRGEPAIEERRADEQEVGMSRVSSAHGFELDAEVIELSKVRPDWLDPRLQCRGIEVLRSSEALIINIDYPLGLAAYEMLVRIYESVGDIDGVYSMGKSATLNGRIGDILIPNVVHDEHSQNTYLFNNVFTATDVAPYLVYGSVLDNQKSVTVRGTFLQNTRYMGVFYREGYTDIEMEAGAYLSAAYEMIQPKRHPYDEIVLLHQASFDIGIIHYASDTPMSKGQNLGAGNLSYRGVDPTYASAVAILRRIIAREIAYLNAASW